MLSEVDRHTVSHLPVVFLEDVFDLLEPFRRRFRAAVRHQREASERLRTSETRSASDVGGRALGRLAPLEGRQTYLVLILGMVTCRVAGRGVEVETDESVRELRKVRVTRTKGATVEDR